MLLVTLLVVGAAATTAFLSFVFLGTTLSISRFVII